MIGHGYRAALCEVSYPTIVPIPTSLSTVTPATEVNNSGAEEPAAIKVAPATSSERSNFSEIASNDGTKKSSQTIASAAKKYISIKRGKYLRRYIEGKSEKKLSFFDPYRGSWVTKNTPKQRSGDHIMLSFPCPHFRGRGRRFCSFSRTSKRCVSTTLIQKHVHLRNSFPPNNVFLNK